MLGGVSIIASIIGTFFVKVKDGGKIMNALYRGVIVSAVLAAIAFYPITTQLMGDNSYGAMNLYWCALIGLALTGAMVVDHRVLHRHRVQAGAAHRRRPRPPATAPTSSPAWACR